MENHTTETYQMKREILRYSRRISESTGKDIWNMMRVGHMGSWDLEAVCFSGSRTHWMNNDPRRRFGYQSPRERSNLCVAL